MGAGNEERRCPKSQQTYRIKSIRKGTDLGLLSFRPLMRSKRSAKNWCPPCPPGQDGVFGGAGEKDARQLSSLPPSDRRTAQAHLQDAKAGKGFAVEVLNNVACHLGNAAGAEEESRAQACWELDGEAEGEKSDVERYRSMMMPCGRRMRSRVPS